MVSDPAFMYALPRLTFVLLTKLPPSLRDAIQLSGPVQIAYGLLDASVLPVSFALQWRAYLDQRARAPFNAASLVLRLLDIDRRNTRYMQQLVAAVGWPGQSLVGHRGAFAAWLLVQHADRELAFQQQCLGLLTAAVAAGEAEARHLAYLVDRVRVAEGKPQVYGTQCGWHGQPRPIENPQQVDERRAAVGLEPLAEYLAAMQHARSGPKPTAR